MSGVTVRPKYGTHPRLSILGPIEARLTHFDRVIIGEVNENIWPQAVTADPWMSRPMKREFGFPLPERTVGVGAYDFSQLLANEEVFLTRAERVMGTPMVKSRWWMRLETVLKALNIPMDSLEDNIFKSWAKFLDRSEILQAPFAACAETSGQRKAAGYYPPVRLRTGCATRILFLPSISCA